jgi:hypothetical protein
MSTKQAANAALNDMLRAAGVVNFAGWELCKAYSPRWKGDRYQVPPESLRRNIIPAAQFAQALRDIVGRVDVLSGYRTGAYNVIVGGSQNSRHVSFHALDLRPLEADWDTFLAAAARLVEAWRSQGHMVGFATYGRRFIHIDIGQRAQQWTQVFA